MTEKFHFNFDDAIAQARRDYPQETAYLAFVDSSKPDAAEKIDAWVEQLPFLLRRTMKKKGFTKSMLEKGNCCFMIPSTGIGIVIVNGAGDNVHLIDDPDKMAAFTFKHELAHAIIPDAYYSITDLFLNEISKKDSDIRANKIEIAADSFAALSGMKDGFLDNEDIARLFLNRVVNAINSANISHLTLPVLERVIVLGEEATDFLSLTPVAIKAIAEDHARTFSPSKQELEQTMDFLSKNRTLDDLFAAAAKKDEKSLESRMMRYSRPFIKPVNAPAP